MSGREISNGVSAPRKISEPQVNFSKQRDEDLLLFREMHKREKDRHSSLLHPISDEFEANGNNASYRMASGKRGPGLEFLAESGKNEYDWLKTPPATPLFPSLDMEANAPDLVIQRELTIIQPLSRFAGNSETVTASTQTSKSPNPKPKLAVRHITPSRKPSTSTSEKKNMKSAPVINLKMNLSCTHGIKTSSASTTSKSIQQKENHPNFLASKLSKSMGVDSSTKSRSRGVSPLLRSKISAQIPGFSDETPPASNLSKSMGVDSSTKPRSRGVSPLVRSRISAQIPGFSDETPPNLKTDRSLSASRGRSGDQNLPVGQKRESGMKARRQSCSPSVTRGRKLETEGNTAFQRGGVQQINRSQIVGSRMVDKFLNARMSSAEERKIRTKSDGSMNESSGFGRVMSKSSLDMALKHMDFQRYSVDVHGDGPTNVRNSSTNSTQRRNL